MVEGGVIVYEGKAQRGIWKKGGGEGPRLKKLGRPERGRRRETTRFAATVHSAAEADRGGVRSQRGSGEKRRGPGTVSSIKELGHPRSPYLYVLGFDLEAGDITETTSRDSEGSGRPGRGSAAITRAVKAGAFSWRKEYFF